MGYKAAVYFAKGAVTPFSLLWLPLAIPLHLSLPVGFFLLALTGITSSGVISMFFANAAHTKRMFLTILGISAATAAVVGPLALLSAYGVMKLAKKRKPDGES